MREKRGSRLTKQRDSYHKGAPVKSLGRLLLSAFVLLFAGASHASQNNTSALSETPPTHELFDPSKYLGKVVYVDFWATWCIPCRKAFPWMNETKERFGPRGLEMVLINLDKKKTYVEEFLLEYPVNGAVMVYDPAAVLAKLYQVRAMPTAYLIDRRGVIRYTHQGFLSKRVPDYEREIEELLNEKD